METDKEKENADQGVFLKINYHINILSFIFIGKRTRSSKRGKLPKINKCRKCQF